MSLPRIYHGDLDPFTLYEHSAQSGFRNRSGSTAKTGSNGIQGALPALGHAVSGCAGAVISKTILYPLDLLITRLQIQSVKAQRNADEAGQPPDPNGSRRATILSEATQVFRKDGMSGFYAGLGPELAKTGLDSFFFFLSYTSLQKARKDSLAAARKTAALPTGLQSLAAADLSGGGRSQPPPLSVLDDLVIGMMAGALSKLVSTPFGTVVSRRQVFLSTDASEQTDEKTDRDHGRAATDGSADTPRHEPTTMSTFQLLLSTPVSELWAGYPFALLLTINPALTFLVQTVILRLFVRRKKRSNPPAMTMFVIAALSKALACLVTYPIGLARTCAVLSSSSTPASKQSGPSVMFSKLMSPFVTINRIARDGGIGSLYAGVGAEMSKGFLGHGFTMLSKSRIHEMVVRLYWIAAGHTLSQPEHPAAEPPSSAEEVGDIVDEIAKRIDGQK